MRKHLLHALGLVSLLLVGAGCSFGGGAEQVQISPITLTYWRMGGTSEAFQPIIEAYRKVRPNVTIQYLDIPPVDYERKLLEALAENRGPDMFSVPINQFAAWKGKIVPMPKETTIPTLVVNKDKKIVAVNQKSATLGLIGFRRDFTEGATRDLVMPIINEETRRSEGDAIWGLPFSYDTLGMYYNKSLLKKANIEKPPTNWREVQEQTAKLTILADDGSIKQSGAAIGGGKNVLYSPDILAAIMAQLGAVVTDEQGNARFHTYADEDRGGVYPPGVEALIFYQSFANKGTQNYAWNETMPLSLDAFVTGRTAFFFGYPADMSLIRERAPGLDFGIAPLPQQNPSLQKNIAVYPAEVVSKKSANQEVAWDFLQFASSAERMSDWLTATKRPTALRSLIESQLTNADIAPFAGQILTGRSWYRGKDWPTVEKAFHSMITWRPTERYPEYQRAVSDAAGILNSTLY